MSSPDRELLHITALLRDRALVRYRADLEAEAALRQERAQIDGLRQSALREDLTPGVRQALGLNGLWQGWLMQRRTELQIGIAQARAGQGYTGAAAQAAFARDEAARTLAARANLARRAKRLAAEERSLEDLARLRLWHGGG